MISRVLTACVLIAFCSGVSAEQEKKRMSESIQDNSFLVEEAYNQEAGVVQHIFSTQFAYENQAGGDDREWLLNFTQEWPVFSQRHQFSYSLLYAFLDRAATGDNGFGDVLLNYRFQALFESDTLPAFAPRFSLILPTGDESKGLGDDTLGYQFNLPFSKVMSDRWTLHANAGLTFFPDMRDHTPVSYNLGASGIYAASENLNFMLELVGYWVETVDEAGRLEDDFRALLSPGLRYAVNWPTSQLVLGLAVPVGLNEASSDVGVFLYASFEHVFCKERK